MNFTKTFFASCLGSLLALITLCFIGFILLVSISSDKEVAIGDNSVLHLKLETPIRELELEDPFTEIFPGAASQMGLVQIRQAIVNAKTDPKIKGIYLNTSMLMTGMSTVQELRDAILDFKTSGKWVIAYADYYSEGAYYLATAADEVYMNPDGEVEFNGLAAEVTFYKKLLDKLEINVQIFRVGDFKSAVEPFFRESLSDENKLQLNSILNSIYGKILHDISDKRKIPFEKLKEMSDKMAIRSSEQAVSNGLIDSLVYDDQIQEILKAKLGITGKKSVSMVKYAKYRKSFTTSETSSNEIAVIVADGDIMPGKTDQGVVGSTTIVEQVRKARNNDKVKAIIIRVNSPGGVFQAADAMWREISLATRQKPVIASMSDYAASGGYFMVMACDTIVAQPTTITGSIGVFSIVPDLSKFFDNKIGITSEEVKTGEIGQLPTISRPLTDVEKSILQKQTDDIYDIFTTKAAEGRHMKVEDLRKIASGRVWTGQQAKDNGLVDVLGGFTDAVRIAATKAGVGEDYKLRFYPKPQSLIERLMGDWEDNTRANALRTELGDLYPLYLKWQKVKDQRGTQARMPIEFSIR